MIYKVVTLLAIIALAQAKSTGKFASFGSPPKNDIRDEDPESKPTARLAKYSPPSGNFQVQSSDVDYSEPKSNNNYAGLRPNVEDYNGYDDEYYNGHPKYKYTYSVNDENTGDYKSHFEERDGDTVRGEYVVADPDGTVRKVTYTADSKNGFQAIVKTTKNNSPNYEHTQQENNYNYKPHTRPAIPTENSDYNKYYQEKPETHTENNYNKYYQQKPENQLKPSYTESDYDKFYQQKPRNQPKPSYTENDVDTKYYQQKPADNTYTRPSVDSNQNDYKSYVRPTIPTETNFKPYTKSTESRYKQYLKPTPQPRHHNLVSQLKYQDRLSNHRLSGPGLNSEEDLKEVPETFNLNSYKFGKGQESGSGGRYNSGYSFRPKPQKDQEGLGSEVFASYASPDFEFDEYSPYRYIEQ